MGVVMSEDEASAPRVSGTITLATVAQARRFSLADWMRTEAGALRDSGDVDLWKEAAHMEQEADELEGVEPLCIGWQE